MSLHVAHVLYFSCLRTDNFVDGQQTGKAEGAEQTDLRSGFLLSVHGEVETTLKIFAPIWDKYLKFRIEMHQKHSNVRTESA